MPLAGFGGCEPGHLGACAYAGDPDVAVNDSERFNQLVRLGVDGITTDNLPILRALSR
jgi:hypothetical protein